MPPPGQYSLARTPGNLAVHEVATTTKVLQHEVTKLVTILGLVLALNGR
jgi:hypothetical protein